MIVVAPLWCQCLVCSCFSPGFPCLVQCPCSVLYYLCLIITATSLPPPVTLLYYHLPTRKTLSLVDLGLKSAFVIIWCFVSSYKISTPPPYLLCLLFSVLHFACLILHVSTLLNLTYYPPTHLFPWTVLSSVKNFASADLSNKMRRP